MRALLICAALLSAALAWPLGSPAQPLQAAELAPNGRLRVGFQVASPILAKRAADGTVSGVVIDLGVFIAERLGVVFVPVVYANQEAYGGSFGRGEWDLALGVAGAAVRERTDTGPDFMLADAMYIAAPGREFADASSIDRAGVKVGVSRGGGSDQYLSRALQSAQVFRVPGGVANAVEALSNGSVDVWAANPVTLQQIEQALAGAKLVPGAWTTAHYAASLPKGRSVAAQHRLAEIVNEAKRSGVVRAAIERAGFKGVHVALP